MRSCGRGRTGFEEEAIHAHVRPVASAKELSVIAVERPSEGSSDSGRPRYTRVAMNDEALDLGDVLLRERPDLHGLLGREEVGFGMQIGRQFGIGE